MFVDFTDSIHKLKEKANERRGRGLDQVSHLKSNLRVWPR